MALRKMRNIHSENESGIQRMTGTNNYQIDITAELCPMTFVRTKLRIERMGPGEILEIRLKGIEPLNNIPRSLAELGHEILSLTREDGEGDLGVHCLIVRKK